ncbi:hypothetical protein OIO90_001439 [Microbotryomycetes sp. JL221]|nr:hypothetical protein OIO90_001439 [Microbotryomycetes sp. JL221]
MWSTAVGWKRLPIELQTLLTLELRTPNARQQVLAQQRQTCRRYIAITAATTPSTAASPSRLGSAAVVDTAARRPTDLTTTSTSSIFESTTREYDNLPPSSLDWPRRSQSPRSPDQALLSLLQQQQYDDAFKLLQEFQQSQQLVKPNLAFAKHAVAAFNDQIHKLDNDSSSSSLWLELWQLTPSLTYLDRVRNLGHTQVQLQLKRIRREATLILDELLSRGRHWSQLQQFATLLAQQGHSSLINDKVLGHVAAYAPFQLGEQLYIEAVAALNDRLPPAAQASNSLQQQYQRRLQRLEKQERLLERAREQMVLTHMTFGRLGPAVEALEQTCQLGLVTRRHIAGMRKKAYLRLMAALVDNDQFDLFQRVHECLTTFTNWQLIRVTSDAWSNRLPYMLRGSLYDANEQQEQQQLSAPTAQEVFATWRYSHHTSELEEGSLVEHEPTQQRQSFDRPSDVMQVALADEPVDFDGASRVLVRQISQGVLPPKLVLAQWIQHAQHDQQQGDGAENQRRQDLFNMISKLLDSGNQTPVWIRRHWLASRVMSCLWQHQYVTALDIVKTSFDLSGLPQEFQQAIWALSSSRSQDKLKPRLKLLEVNASMFELVTTCLVRTLDELSTQQQQGNVATSTTVIDSLYKALLRSDPAINVVPRQTTTQSSTATFDSHAFTPFMQSLLYRQDQVDPVINIILDMQDQFDFRPTKQQIGILLSLMSRTGSDMNEDIVWLLNRLENDDHESTPRPSRLKLDLLHRIEWPCRSEERQPDVVAYTSIVVGCIMRGDFEFANVIVDRVNRRIERDDTFKVDDKWTSVVRRVRDHSQA